MSNVTVNNNTMNQVRDELNRRLSDVGYFVENQAKNNMDGHNRTGTLRRSITNQVNKNESSVTIGTNVEYAPAFHEGHGRFAGVHFLRDAVFQHMPEIQNLLRSD